MPENLKIDIIEVGVIVTNCYLVYDNGHGIIIDPGDESEKILGMIDNAKVRIDKIVLTHGHIDHIHAVPEIKQATGAPVLIHPADATMLTDAKENLSYYHNIAFATDPADGFLNEDDTIEIGSGKLKVIHTPGHTPGGISLYSDGMLFSGDALFWGSIGRTDFPGSNHEDLINAITEKLLILPEDTKVYPGHGPETTIGYEKTINPWLS
jgi:hydroxyacylglutathione hydrolase